MSVKAIREYHGKKIMQQLYPEDLGLKALLITPEMLSKPDVSEVWKDLASENPWLLEERLVVKPDQLVKRRGKNGLVYVNKTWDEVRAWIEERMQKNVTIDNVTGPLTHFIVEPITEHKPDEELYVCIQSLRYADEIFFYHEGGVDVGDVDAKASKLEVPVDEPLNREDVLSKLLAKVPEKKKERVATFICELYAIFLKAHFTYLEINPLVVTDNLLRPVDCAAKLDETAAFLCESHWHGADFPAPFGRASYPEEKFIANMDAKSGASLKLTILNIHGRVWTMVAGGGASVVFADTVCDYGYGHELANYGEYSGSPTTEETFVYAKTLFSLMTRHKRDEPKILLVGGGIANFTDVNSTFTGLIKAIREYRDEFLEQRVQIWVRRAGLNHIEGLKNIKAKVTDMQIPIHVYGPEVPATLIVPMGLGITPPIEETWLEEASGQPSKTPVVELPPPSMSFDRQVTPGSVGYKQRHHDHFIAASSIAQLQTNEDTRALVYNLQTAAVQRMLDFDYMCKRKKPSVAGLVYAFGGQSSIKVYWGSAEIFIPVYASIAKAIEADPDVNFLVSFASFRSAFDSAMEALAYPDKIKTIAIIAEGVPERQTRSLIKKAEQLKVGIIGPATVGGITPGKFRIGNTGGAVENITMSKLYRPGSVCYVSKSGGMSNELNNIIARNSDGVCDGCAIGGDRYPGSRLVDHVLKYQANPNCKLIVILGEVGGIGEYGIVDAVNKGEVTKPLIGWCVGTCADCFNYDVQFGHAGAQARDDLETAAAKNLAMKRAGIIVPKSFNHLGEEIKRVWSEMVKEGKVTVDPEPEVPAVVKDFAALQKAGLVRKPANFVCSVSDDRGEECTYAGMPISQVVDSGLGLAGALSLLWFRRRLPDPCLKFIEICLVTCADHGPAVSGAHSTIVAARAGKDLVSSLCSGLLTVGPRFGGALDDAAKFFKAAADRGISPKDFVNQCKKDNVLIMGIGHRIKSKTNPDMRVEGVKKYALEHFNDPKVLKFALGVEEVTTSKKANLILNVDGCIAACFVDMMRCSGAFKYSEVDEFIEDGGLNGIFVLARSVGLIGHFLDQKRQKQPLYRHPFDDILYMSAGAGDAGPGNAS